MRFEELRDDFLRIVSDVVWCPVATVDTRGRPRTRVMRRVWRPD